MDPTVFDISVAIMMLVVSVTMLVWFKRYRAAASNSRMTDMMSYFALDAEIVTNGGLQALPFKQVQQRETGVVNIVTAQGTGWITTCDDVNAARNLGAHENLPSLNSHARDSSAFRASCCKCWPRQVGRLSKTRLLPSQSSWIILPFVVTAPCSAVSPPQ